jgi:GWxTD domain-containing protein
LRIILFFFLIFSFALSQFFSKKEKKGSGFPVFDVHVNEVFVDSLEKICSSVSLNIFNDDLTFFRKKNGTYEAKFTATLSVYKKDSLIKTQFITKKVTVKNFDGTNKKNTKSYIKDCFNLEPGKYLLKAYLRDINSQKQIVRDKYFEVQKQSDLFQISDLKFFDIVEESKTLNQKRIFTNRTGKILVNLVANFSGLKDSLFYHIKINSLIDNKIVYSKKIKIAPKETNQKIEIFFKKSFFTKSNYMLFATVDDEKGNKVSKKARFTFIWDRYPTNKLEMSETLQKMYYIANNDSINFYMKQPLEKSQKFFLRVWFDLSKSKTSGEVQNLVREYFSRVSMAIKSFSTYKENGWQTDRGRILIKFGYPDDIQYFPFEANRRSFTVWKYYQKQKTFIFIDDGFSGFVLDEQSKRLEFSY